jgi:hypothetical protein
LALVLGFGFGYGYGFPSSLFLVSQAQKIPSPFPWHPKKSPPAESPWETTPHTTQQQAHHTHQVPSPEEEHKEEGEVEVEEVQLYNQSIYPMCF